jgi:hypothetical protein
MKISEQQALDLLEEGIKFMEVNPKEALQYFIKANQTVAEYSVRRVKILYYLALCNYAVGHIPLAYAILEYAQSIGTIASQLTFFVAETIPREDITMVDLFRKELENSDIDLSESSNYTENDFNTIY